MAEPTLLSPNVGNLRIGKGVAKLKKVGAAEPTHLGNCPAISIEPAMETLDHFSSMAGVRLKDLSVILEKGGTLSITMEEFTAFNLSLMLAGSVDEVAVGGPEIGVFDTDAINGEFTFTSTNDIGPKFDVTLYNVSFLPSGQLDLISDEWGNLEVEAQILAATEGANVGKFGIIKVTNVEVPAS